MAFVHRRMYREIVPSPIPKNWEHLTLVGPPPSRKYIVTSNYSRTGACGQ